MTTTRFFSYLDPGAPVITGEVGTVKDALKIMLYGDGSGVAYGTGSNEKLAAGWSIAFESGNKIALQNSLAAGGSGCVVRIDDDAPGAGGAREAFMRAYASMSDIDTGSDPAPSTSMTSSGIVLRKSGTLDSTARPWFCVADERTFYLSLYPNQTAWVDGSGVAQADAPTNLCGAGDFESLVPGDPYPYFCGGRGTVNNGNLGVNGLMISSTGYSVGNAMTTSFALGRGIAGTGAAVNACLSHIASQGGGIGMDNVTTNPAAGSSLEMWQGSAPIISESTIRGFLRGIYLPLSSLTAVPPGTIRANVANLPSGHQFVIARSGSKSTTAAPGGLGIEIALEW